jgi:hypothetical protein
VRVPALFVWPGMIDADRVSDGLMSFSDLLPTAMTLAGAPERVPTDRYVDGIDQTSFLLAKDGTSCRKYHYYWLVETFSGLRVGEYKWMLSSTSDDAVDVHGAGGFTGVTQRYTYPRLFNLIWTSRRQELSHAQAPYLEVLRDGMRAHLATFQAYRSRVMGLGTGAPSRPPRVSRSRGGRTDTEDGPAPARFRSALAGEPEARNAASRGLPRSGRWPTGRGVTSSAGSAAPGRQQRDVRAFSNFLSRHRTTKCSPCCNVADASHASEGHFDELFVRQSRRSGHSGLRVAM